jgi:hypothetical protein
VAGRPKAVLSKSEMVETGKYSPHFQYDGWGGANGTFGRKWIWFRVRGLRGIGGGTGVDRESDADLVVKIFAKAVKTSRFAFCSSTAPQQVQSTVETVFPQFLKEIARFPQLFRIPDTAPNCVLLVNIVEKRIEHIVSNDTTVGA